MSTYYVSYTKPALAVVKIPEAFEKSYFLLVLNRNEWHNFSVTVALKGTIKCISILKYFINGEDTMAVLLIYQLEGHSGSAFHGIFITTGRTEATVTVERNKF